MNLYQTLNQDLREFRMKTLLENEETKVEEPIVNETEVVEETEMTEDDIARQLVSLSDALETASEDEIPAIEQEIKELEAKLNEISANRDLASSDDVIEDSEDEEITEEVPEVTEEVSVEETPEVEEPTEEKVCLSVDEIKDIISELCDEDKEKVREFLDSKEDDKASEDEVEEPEEFHECEISNYKVVRRAPSSNAYMIEAQTKEGIKFITGKNFNEETKTLDEAEISDSKSDATNRFKDLLANK